MAQSTCFLLEAAVSEGKLLFVQRTDGAVGKVVFCDLLKFIVYVQGGGRGSSLYSFPF